jgi:hypothetical protein
MVVRIELSAAVGYTTKFLQCLGKASNAPCAAKRALSRCVLLRLSGLLPDVMNWLRVLGTAELPHIDQGVRHQFHAKVSLLRVFKTKEEPLEFIFPRKCPIDTSPQCMDSGIKEPLAPSLGSLAVARILCDVGDQAGIENTLSDVLGIKARVKIQIGSCEVQTDRFSHSLQGFQTLWQQEYVRLIDGSH